MIDGTLQVLPEALIGSTPTVEAARLIVTPTHPSILVIKGQTLLAGSDITVSSTTYSLPKSGSELIVNGQPMALPSANPYEVYTIGSLAITPTLLPDSASVTALLINEQAILLGSNLIFAGTIYSLPTSGSELFVNGKPTPLPSVVRDQRLILGSLTVTPVLLADESPLLIEGKTLSPGSALVALGTTYSLPSSAGSEFYVNGRATVLPFGMLSVDVRVGSATALEASPASGGSVDSGGPSEQAENTTGSADESGVMSVSACSRSVQGSLGFCLLVLVVIVLWL